MAHAPRTARSWARAAFALGWVALLLVLVPAGSGSFTATADTSSNNPTYGSCTIALAGIGGNVVDNRLELGISAITPGQVIQRTVKVTNLSSASGCVNATNPYRLTTRTTGCAGTCASSLMDSDVTTSNRLQLQIDRCSVPWTEAGVSPAYTYTCGGTTLAVLTSTPVNVTNATLTNMIATLGSDNYLRVQLTLPAAVPATFQGLTSRMEWEFALPQRAGASQ